MNLLKMSGPYFNKMQNLFHRVTSSSMARVTKLRYIYLPEAETGPDYLSIKIFLNKKHKQCNG